MCVSLQYLPLRWLLMTELDSNVGGPICVSIGYVRRGLGTPGGDRALPSEACTLGSVACLAL